MESDDVVETGRGVGDEDAPPGLTDHEPGAAIGRQVLLLLGEHDQQSRPAGQVPRVRRLGLDEIAEVGDDDRSGGAAPDPAVDADRERHDIR